jgi:hypothetical protein
MTIPRQINLAVFLVLIPSDEIKTQLNGKGDIPPPNSVHGFRR